LWSDWSHNRATQDIFTQFRSRHFLHEARFEDGIAAAPAQSVSVDVVDPVAAKKQKSERDGHEHAHDARDQAPRPCLMPKFFALLHIWSLQRQAF
jgi:hypothetical protein